MPETTPTTTGAWEFLPVLIRVDCSALEKHEHFALYDIQYAVHVLGLGSKSDLFL